MTAPESSCYAGMLMLQAMGLGGWMVDGIDRHTVLGASGDPEVPGLDGIFESFTPPYHADMTAAVEAFADRKFGPGDPFHPDTPGPYHKRTPRRGRLQWRPRRGNPI